MASQSSGSERKQPGYPNLGKLLNPGEWRNKRARSCSPSRYASTSGTRYSHSPAQSNPNSRSPSPVRNPGPPSHGSPTAAPSAPTQQPNSSYRESDSVAGVSTSTQNSTGVAWTGLEQALRALRITTKICPPLSSAVDDLASCLHIFEAAARNRSDHEELATGLKSMVDLLIRHLNSADSSEVLDAIKDIANAIRNEIEFIKAHQSRSLPHRILGASSTQDDLIRRYRRIEQLFRQLQGEASMSTWSTVNELLIDKRLENLRPAKLARFDSELSTEVSRRGCTKDTRTKILEDSTRWSENPDLAKIYWMNGMAGTGKTTIAYSFCERLKTGKQLAASFFCTRASPECREAKRIIPTIAYQLARRLAPFRYALCQLLKQDPDIGTGQLSNQFDLLLKRPLLEAKDKLSNNLVIVVDALDECTDPHIVELFLDLLFCSVVDLPIKFFVTSRPEPAIRSRMMVESEHSRSILYLHEIEQSLVQADIELYLQEELTSISPGDADIQELAEHAGNLFIYAATAVRYIRPVGKAVNSKGRLAAILAIRTESKKQLSAIDALYSAILTAAINDEGLEREEQDRMRHVLWTTVCACEPVLIDTLSALSGLDNKDDTIAALQPLRSVLHVSEHNELVTTLHASFPDYILTQERSGEFYCDKVTHSRLLAEQCFKVMHSQLRFNICSIRSSFTPDDEITELGDQIDASISNELFYSSRFWADHLSEADPDGGLLLLVHEFLSQQLLFWMEVLNLKRCMVIGVISTTKLNTWLTRVHIDTCTSNLLELASDSHRFVASYTSSPASSYTPHIYLTALPLSRPSSSVRSWYLPRFKGLVKVSGTILDRLEKAALGTWASTSSIPSAVFSPDGGCIVLGDERGRISVRNAYDGKYLVQPFKAHNKVITSIGISSNGMQIVSGSHDMTLSIWNMHDGSLVSGPFKGHTDGVTSVAFSPDATHIVSGSYDHSIRIWNPDNASVPIKSFTGHREGVKSVAFSPDGSRLVSGSLDHTIRLWDLSTGATIFVLQGHTQPVSTVLFSPDGTRIISGSNDCTVRMWNASDGSPSCQPLEGHSQQITSIAVSPGVDHIVSGSLDRTIRVWDRHSGEPIARSFEGHAGSIRSVCFSNDGMRILSASEDKTVRVWNTKGQIQETEEALVKGFNCLKDFTSSLNQTHVAFRDLTKPSTFHVWELRTLAHVVIATNAEIKLLQFSPDGACIHSLHTPGTLCTWDTQTGELLGGPHRCSTRFTPEGVSVACSYDGRRVVTLHESEPELWHIPSNQQLAFNVPPKMWLIRAIFSQDGNRFVTSCYRGADVWDADSGAHVAGPFSRVDVYDLSPDGTYICCKSHFQPFHLINVNSGESITMPPTKYFARSPTFTSDGLSVAGEGHEAGAREASVCWIWNIRDQTVTPVTARIKASEAYIMELVRFSPEGWLLLWGPHEGVGGGVHVWRFHIDNPPFIMSSGGWVLDTQGRPLLWVAIEIREEFPLCSGVIISDHNDVLQRVDYDGMLVGDNWSECYVNNLQNTSNVII